MLFTSLFSSALLAAEAGRLPDAVVRAGIRNLLRRRVRASRNMDCQSRQELLRAFLADCSRQPVAVVPERANEQHYEVPAAFFKIVLGPHRKYSCCEWNAETATLADAERQALDTTCARAQLADGQRILELGCGWGSLSLWMAQRYPAARITAVSNSHSQREFIEQRAKAAGLSNLDVVTADMNAFQPDGRFDRVVSVEMFEHMRNHRELLRRISTWLLPGGKLFVHHFSHRDVPYLFEDHGPADWMTRCFFAGGMMPSDNLLARYQEDLALVDQWRWSGRHYQRTCGAWLRNLDADRDAALRILASVYGAEHAELWLQRWRMFFMSCEELFGFRGGEEWWVTHLLFERRA